MCQLSGLIAKRPEARPSLLLFRKYNREMFTCTGILCHQFAVFGSASLWWPFATVRNVLFPAGKQGWQSIDRCVPCGV